MAGLAQARQTQLLIDQHTELVDREADSKKRPQAGVDVWAAVLRANPRSKEWFEQFTNDQLAELLSAANLQTRGVKADKAERCWKEVVRRRRIQERDQATPKAWVATLTDGRAVLTIKPPGDVPAVELPMSRKFAKGLVLACLEVLFEEG